VDLNDFRPAVTRGIAFHRIVECVRLDVHHVVKRAQGGSDFDLDRLVALCPPCHAQTDAPYARGRLVITPLGEGRFTVEVTRRADKWAIRA